MIKSIKALLALALPLWGLLMCGMLSACSENDDIVEEFVDWQNYNDTYFVKLHSSASEKIAGGDASWKVIRAWSKPADNPDYSYTTKPTDCIVARVLHQGEGTELPLFTDKVLVHYQGRLLPSTSFASGYVFDQSYYDAFDVSTAVPASFAIKGVVDGFGTALLNMHKGDRWEVYIPYQLGYGEKASGVIPAYSTLVFVIELVDFYHPDADRPAYN